MFDYVSQEEERKWTMGTMTTRLEAVALIHDLERYRDSVDQDDRERIMKRMVDTVDDALKITIDEDHLRRILDLVSQGVS